MVRQFHFSGDEVTGRQRLDHFLATCELAISRAQLRRMIDDGSVRVNGQPAKAGQKLRRNDDVEVCLRPAEPCQVVAQDIALEVLYEDEHLIVINKPAGLVVHPAPGHPDGTLVNALLGHCDDLSGVGGELRPGIVHRLDRLTSGVMVASKNDDAHHGLAEQFATKSILREYVAVIAPAPRVAHGTFSTLYGRHPVDRKKFSSRVKRGKTAITHYEVERQFGVGGDGSAALIRCRLDTGRTHQIRVHFSDGGMALIGDPIYGHKLRDPGIAALAGALGRQALHAGLLEFLHPALAKRLRFEAPIPDDMRQLIEGLKTL